MEAQISASPVRYHTEEGWGWQELINFQNCIPILDRVHVNLTIFAPLQASSLDFLREHGFDFNKFIYSGGHPIQSNLSFNVWALMGKLLPRFYLGYKVATLRIFSWCRFVPHLITCGKSSFSVHFHLPCQQESTPHHKSVKGTFVLTAGQKNVKWPWSKYLKGVEVHGLSGCSSRVLCCQICLKVNLEVLCSITLHVRLVANSSKLCCWNRTYIVVNSL